MRRVNIFTLVVGLLGGVAAVEGAYWPLPDDHLPETAAQTWQQADGTIEISDSFTISNAPNDRLGYTNNGKIKDNNQACGDKACRANPDYVLTTTPNWSVPEGAVPINLNDQPGTVTLNSNTIYYTTEEAKFTSSNGLSVGENVTLFAPLFNFDKSTLTVANDEPNNFVLVSPIDEEVGDGIVTIAGEDGSDFYGHIIAQSYIDLKDMNVKGTLTSDEIKVYGAGSLNTAPGLPRDGDLCSFQGNEDFVLTFETTGSDLLHEVYFTQGNRREQTLWYNQQHNSDPDYIFNEQDLIVGETYQVRIEYHASTGTEYYYLKGPRDSDYRFVEAKNVPIKSGNLVGNGLEISGLKCQNEPVSPPAPELPDVCPLFPDTIASNRYQQQGDMWVPADGFLNITGGNGDGNRVILEQRLAANSLAFSSSIVERNTNDFNGCVYQDGELEGGRCEVSAEVNLFPDGPPLAEAFTPSGPAIQAPDNQGNIDLEPGSYSSFAFGMNISSITLAAGEYWVGELIFNNNEVSILVDGPVVLHYNKMTFTSSNIARIFLNAGKVNEGYDYHNLTMIGHGSESHWSPGSVEDLFLNGSLYISPLATTGLNLQGTKRFQMVGALAVSAIDFQAIDDSFIKGVLPSDCQPPVPADRSLLLTPKRAINLTCDAPQLLDFQVLDSSGEPDGNFDGNVIVNFSGSTTYTSDIVAGGANGGNSYTTNDRGLLQMSLSDTTVGQVSVEAYIEGSEGSTLQQGQYDFVPNTFQFSPSPVRAIANKIEPTSIQAMQCGSSGNPEPIPEDIYSGDKSIVLSSTRYIQPQVEVNNPVNIELRETGTSAWTSVDNSAIDLTFSSTAIADIDLRYAEAGIVSYEASDEICIVDDEGIEQCESIKGLQQVDSIPWTFAICHNEKSLNGTAYEGDAFIAAGRTFALELKPLQYQDGASVDPELGINVIDMCNSAVTQNFFGSDASLGSATVDALLATPEASVGGSLGQGLQGEKMVTNTAKDTLNLTHLMWDEVGSLNVQASGTLLQRQIATGYRNVGRFYPDHLLLVSDYFDTPIGHDEFTYMSQPVAGHGFVVEARNGLPEGESTDNITNNYGLFAQSQMVTIDYDAFDDQNNDLIARLTSIPSNLQWTGSAWGETTGQLAIDFTSYQFEREAIGSNSGAELTTRPDGPYDRSNSSIGLRVSAVVDDLNWQDATEANELKLFSDDYDFRYGRMVLSDVAGNSNSEIIVPLKVEYWDSSRFVRNGDDGTDSGNGILGSRYDGQYFCAQHVWQDSTGTSEAQLAGYGGVIEGEPMQGTAASGETSTPLVANQGSNSGDRREQVRLWLHIGDSSPLKHNTADANIDCTANNSDRPWLRYNWRDLGDEDPSAQITFGTYRGNDRVIYRGETGLTGN